MNTSHRRKFTDDEKQKVVDEAMIRGINVVLQERRLSYSVFSRWKKQFFVEETDKTKRGQKVVKQLNELIVENEKLKKIIANQAMELQIEKGKI